MCGDGALSLCGGTVEHHEMIVHCPDCDSNRVPPEYMSHVSSVKVTLTACAGMWIVQLFQS